MNDGSKINAVLKDFDTDKDIAMLNVNMSRSAKYLNVSSKLPRQGEEVIAFSNPRGLSGTVTNGIVSAFRDNNSLLQFTAPESPGSSGGALLNLRGEVVGMITANLKGEGQNLNFAVPSTVLGEFLRNAINKPARELPKPQKPNVASRPQPKPAPKSSEGSGIPLPDAKGFLVHKWGCSVESIRRYVSSPLNSVGNTGTIFTTGKAFKAFRAKVDTVVYYVFYNGKLDAIHFLIKDSRSNASLEPILTGELIGLYGIYSDSQHEADGTWSKYWLTSDLAVVMSYNSKQDYLSVLFSPR